MIVYLDTSALVKLYVDEAGSDEVAGSVEDARLVATSRVAYPEARAAFARRRREGGMTSAGLRRAVLALERDLSSYVLVEVDAALAREAGDLAERRALRGAGAIHLASALMLSLHDPLVPRFLAFDRRLLDAAAAEGLDVSGRDPLSGA